jgi:hypothetical protein
VTAIEFFFKFFNHFIPPTSLNEKLETNPKKRLRLFSALENFDKPVNSGAGIVPAEPFGVGLVAFENQNR